MGKFGRKPINDCGKAAPKVSVVFDGEERIERYARGVNERFVDPVGNVMFIQIVNHGDPTPVDTAAKERARKHAEGFIEHGKCPLREGTRYASRLLEADFAKMPADLQRPCEAPPNTKHEKRGLQWHAKESCAHIEWLIDFRRKREAEQNAKRNEQRLAKERQDNELKALQLEIAKEELETRRKRKQPKAAE